MTNPPAPPSRRDGWVELGIVVSAASSAVSSFSGLRALAEVAGWNPIMAWLFPLTVDAYAMTATRVWLATSTRSVRARRFARTNAVGAILMSLCGNAAWHLVAAHLVRVTWPIVLSVGAVPPLVLGLVSHLAVLRTQVDPVRPGTMVVPTAVPVTVSLPAVPGRAKALRRASQSPAHESGDGTRTDDELLAQARAADAAYRDAHAARPITRDALRQALRISGPRATELARRLRDAHLPAPAAASASD